MRPEIFYISEELKKKVANPEYEMKQNQKDPHTGQLKTILIPYGKRFQQEKK